MQGAVVGDSRREYFVERSVVSRGNRYPHLKVANALVGATVVTRLNADAVYGVRLAARKQYLHVLVRHLVEPGCPRPESKRVHVQHLLRRVVRVPTAGVGVNRRARAKERRNVRRFEERDVPAPLKLDSCRRPDEVIVDGDLDGVCSECALRICDCKRDIIDARNGIVIADRTGIRRSAVTQVPVVQHRALVHRAWIEPIDKRARPRDVDDLSRTPDEGVGADVECRCDVGNRDRLRERMRDARHVGHRERNVVRAVVGERVCRVCRATKRAIAEFPRP